VATRSVKVLHDQTTEFNRLLADTNVACRKCGYGQIGQVHNSNLGDQGHQIKWFNCLKCKALNFDVFQGHRRPAGLSIFTFETVLSFPMRSRAFTLPLDLPTNVSADYSEASKLLAISAAASAAFSRRCLQTILKAQGYTETTLARQIDGVLNEAAPSKVVPHYITTRLDVVRNFGNFSVHEMENRATAEILDVQPGEAEWCLEIMEDLIEHYYVRPAAEQAKIDKLNEKLRGAGKPEIKTP
jgi:hypothetical protein